MERYNEGDKVKTIDTWNNGMGKVIPKGSIVTIIYDNGRRGCMCEHNGEDAFYEYDWLGEVVNNPIKTNADRIRSMSDEELAEFLVGLNEHCLAGIGKVDCSSCNGYCEDNCKRMTTNWLQSEVKGSE